MHAMELGRCRTLRISSAQAAQVASHPKKHVLVIVAARQMAVVGAIPLASCLTIAAMTCAIIVRCCISAILRTAAARMHAVARDQQAASAMMGALTLVIAAMTCVSTVPTSAIACDGIN